MTERCPHCGGPMIECSECGKLVARTCGNQSLCEGCRDGVYRKRNRKYQANHYRQKKLSAMKEDPCQSTNTSA